MVKKRSDTKYMLKTRILPHVENFSPLHMLLFCIGDFQNNKIDVNDIFHSRAGVLCYYLRRLNSVKLIFKQCKCCKYLFLYPL